MVKSAVDSCYFAEGGGGGHACETMGEPTKKDRLLAYAKGPRTQIIGF